MGKNNNKFKRQRSKHFEDESYERRTFDERHKGSFDFDELKQTDEYKNRIETSGQKRKYSLCISYLGTKYQGLQVNPDADTIEKHVEKALFLAGGIPEYNFGNLQKIQWTRAARTDAGVHALTQNCSMRLQFPVDQRDQFIENINSFLPSEIKIQAITKVTKAFNAKLFCDKRRYQYLLPTYMLQSYKDVVTSLNKYAVDESSPVDKSSYESIHELFKSFRIQSNTLELFRKALNAYQGTHNFHNFTVGKSYKDPNAVRFIISFEALEPFVDPYTNVEWILLSVVGQSFLLHQIRKMVAMACEVAREFVDISMISRLFHETPCDVPIAPGLGLYLDELFFDGYNMKVDSQITQDQSKRQKILEMNIQKDECDKDGENIAADVNEDNRNDDDQPVCNRFLVCINILNP